MPKKRDSKQGAKPSAGPAKGSAKPQVTAKVTKKKSNGSKPAAILAPSEADYLKSREDIVDNEDSLDILSFYLNDTLFAIEVEYVGAVIMSREIVELPHTPDFIDGLISVRGEMILVMNLKKRLGIETGDIVRGNIIVTEPSSIANEAGMVVDKMAGVMEAVGKLKAPLKGEKKKNALVDKESQGVNYIKGIVESEGKGSIKVLDMESLMAFDMPRK